MKLLLRKNKNKGKPFTIVDWEMDLYPISCNTIDTIFT